MKDLTLVSVPIPFPLFGAPDVTHPDSITAMLASRGTMASRIRQAVFLVSQSLITAGPTPARATGGHSIAVELCVSPHQAWGSARWPHLRTVLPASHDPGQSKRGGKGAGRVSRGTVPQKYGLLGSQAPLSAWEVGKAGLIGPFFGEKRGLLSLCSKTPRHCVGTPPALWAGEAAYRRDQVTLAFQGPVRAAVLWHCQVSWHSDEAWPASCCLTPLRWVNRCQSTCRPALPGLSLFSHRHHVLHDRSGS